MSDVVDTQPSWEESPVAWDTIFIAGEGLPGVCEFRGDKCQKHDKKQTIGSSGTTQTHLGYEPSEILITVRMWESKHWDQFTALLPLLQPPPSKKPPQPVDVWHPALAAYGIGKLYIEKVGLPHHAGKGEWRVEIKATEWNPVKGRSEVATPKASQTDLSKKRTAIPRPKPTETESEP